VKHPIIYSYVTDDGAKVRWTCDLQNGVDASNVADDTDARVAYDFTVPTEDDQFGIESSCHSLAPKDEYFNCRAGGDKYTEATMRWLVGDLD